MVINIVNKNVLKVSYTNALYNETMGKSEKELRYEEKSILF